MRIPSQFSDESLYFRSNGRSAGTYRRILRLALGLALILVVMDAASEESIYIPFFGANQANVIDPPLQKTSGAFLSDFSLARDSEQPLLSGGTVTEPISNQQGGEKDEIAIALGERSRDEKLKVAEGCIDELARLAALAASGSEEATESDLDPPQLSFVELVEILERDPKDSQDLPFSSAVQPQLQQLLKTLMNDFNNQIVDGSVWRSDDHAALKLNVLSANKFPERYDIEKVPTIASSVLQLLQQPDVFKNRLIRASGEVARIEPFVQKELPVENPDRKDAAGLPEANPDRVFPDYYQIWIRPSVGVDRPLVAIVPMLPTSLEAVTQNENLTVGPKVILAGHFIKRLAYRSSIGADLAPVVVGRFWTAYEQQPAAPVQADATSPKKVGLILAAATLLGVSIAAFVMWRTMVSAQATRELRNKQYSKPLELGDIGGAAALAQREITEQNV